MSINLESRGDAGRVRRNRRFACALAAFAAALLLFSVAGCERQGGRGGSKSGASASRGEQAPGAKAQAGGTKTQPGGTKSTSGGTSKTEGTRASAATPGHVHIRDRGCTQFEAHWTTVMVGHRVTWHNHRKVKVVVRIAAGAFDKNEYVVPAGGTETSSPARKPGKYAVWSTPAACQGVPLGVQGTGPGVIVEGGTGSP